MCVVGVAVLGAGVLAAVTATANADGETVNTPPFLEADDLSMVSTNWSSYEIKSGPGKEHFCLPEDLPQKGTYHREFTTTMEARARQIVFQPGHRSRAEALARKLNKAIEDCGKEYVKQFPDDRADNRAGYRSLAELPVVDGGWAHGVATKKPKSPEELRLQAVGWHGDKVTFVSLNQSGTLSDADVLPFLQVADAAAAKLG